MGSRHQPAARQRRGAADRGHIEQLHHRRCDLLDTNLDLLTDIGADNQHNAIVMSEIYANRHGVEALNKVFDAYGDSMTN